VTSGNFDKSSLLACSYGSACSGCDWLFKPAGEQRELKTEALRRAWREGGHQTTLDEVGWVDVAAGGLRDRVDLMFDRRSGTKKLGLFDRFHTGLVDLQGCPQMSEALESWLREFRRFDFPISRGSVRLRVAPDGRRGVWLDFANEDVKALLDAREPLDSLRKIAIVEIGQKRKRLVERDGMLKLGDPVLEPWFETYLHESPDSKPVPLYCTVGSFTQPGFTANRALVTEVMKLVGRVGAKTAAEFGSGIGNFTLPLASMCDTVDAYEVDSLALTGLSRSLEERGLTDRVRIHDGNYQGAKAESLDLSGLDLLLVDPPRSGLMKFLDPLEMTQDRPRSLIYVSCFAESFSRDALRISGLGYALDRISIVDQFPQSRHFEIVASFVRN
jgi:23S rRNA (uracil1939-C5)-methyltransferase